MALPSWATPKPNPFAPKPTLPVSKPLPDWATPKPSPFKPKPGGSSGGGGSGGGQSIASPSGSGGIEVSPTGKVTEVKPIQTTPTKSNFEKIIEKQSPIFNFKPVTKVSDEIMPGSTGTGRGGIIIAKPGEIKGTNLPVWETESKDFGEAFVEANYLGGVSVTSTPTMFTSIFGGRGITTKGQAESAEAQIQTLKEPFREDIGTRREITSSILDINKLQYETSQAFSKDPLQFEGQPGFTAKEVEGGI